MLCSVHMSDVHFGAMNPKVLYKNLKSDFFDKCKKLPKIDVIFIQGDFYDHDISLNSKHALYALKTIEKIVKLAGKFDAKVRFIKGTKSHDRSQLDIISENYSDSDVDVRVINTVDVETIDGSRILYLPEEYIQDSDEYYREYFNDEYDIVVGHGMFDKLSFGHSNNSRVIAAPIFDTETISSITKGYCCFGHIHNAFMFNNIYYTGSFARWMQGEEDPKGFIYAVYNNKTNDYGIAPIINNNALIYKSMSLESVINGYDDPDDVINIIDTYIADNDVYRLRIKCTELNDVIFSGKLSIVKTYYNDSQIVSFDIKRACFAEEDEVEEDMDELSKHDYIFDSSISNEDKISRFMMDSYGVDLSAKKIEKMLNSDISKMLGDMII